MNDVVVSTKKVFKSYSDKFVETKVLQGIDLEVKKGEFVSIMGESGCGKSTLLYIIGGLEYPDSGEVSCCGADWTQLKDKEQSKVRLNNLGFVFQSNNLVQNLTVEENILLPIIMVGKNIDDYKARLDELLNLVGLAEKKNTIPSKLSGGQQQRVALARAVISSPSLILADEPTGNLDSNSGKTVLGILKDLNKDQGITIIMVTHSQDAASYSDRIVHMKDGILCY